MGLERKSGQVLNMSTEKITPASRPAIRLQTFLDCVMAEMSDPNSKLAVYFKELDKRCREIEKANFEEISKGADEVLSSISSNVGVADIAIRSIKDSIGCDISYKIDLDNDVIILKMDDRVYTFRPNEFNPHQVLQAMRSVQYSIMDEWKKTKESCICHEEEMSSLRTRTMKRLFPKKSSKRIAELERQYNEEKEKINSFCKEHDSIQWLLSEERKCSLTFFKAINAIHSEYVNRRTLRHMNQKADAYIKGSYSVEAMEKALYEMVKENYSYDTDDCSPNELFPIIEEKGIRGEYDFSITIPEDIEKLRSLVEWFIDFVYAKDYGNELTDGVYRKRTKKDNN